MSSQTPAVTQKKRDVRDMLNSPAFAAEIAKVLPKHLTPERMTRVALTAFLKTPKLLDCTSESLTNALLVLSQAGLEPDGRLAHLIPYGNVVQVIFDYKGLVALAIRNGMQAVYADKVCEDDVFDAVVEDGVKKVTHRIDFRKSRGDAVCYYAVCQRGGIIDWEVMTVEEVNTIRKRSWASGSGPWVTDYDEMAKKTVLRRMSKRWDLMPEVRDIIYDDDDTPTDIKKVEVTRPMFTSPALPESGAEATDAPHTEPETPPPSDPQPENPSAFNALKAVRNLAKDSKISESSILAHLCGIGAIDENVKTLEEVARRYEGENGKPGVLETVSSQWGAVAKAIRAAGGDQ